MTSLFRSNYAAEDLDPVDGPVPTYGNPGSVTSPMTPFRRDRKSCPRCDVSWSPEDSPSCWSCGLPEPEPCPACDGAGTYPVGERDPIDGVRVDGCPTCNGRGTR